MKVFPILTKAMLAAEQRDSYGSWDARVWPSEASAIRTDTREAAIVGKCHRASFGRLMGWKVTDNIDFAAALRFRTGRLLEEDIVSLAKESGIFVASGVRIHIVDEETGLNLPLELDLVVCDPETGKLAICENKTVYGYGAKKVIEGGEPKPEGLMQSLIYLNEFPNGAMLKHVIVECYQRKQKLAAEIESLKKEGADPYSYKALEREFNRNRIEVDLDKLAAASDSPVETIMLYETRDDCTAREFQVGIFQDDDGNHWPTVDGVPVYLFNLESIYERYQILQGYHERAKKAAQIAVARKGYPEPSENASPLEIWHYREMVLEEMRELGPEYWPPAEYEFRYSRDKIDMLFNEGLMTKSAHARSKINGKTRKDPGAWQCAFCGFKAKCVSQAYPELAYLVADLSASDDSDDEAVA